MSDLPPVSIAVVGHTNAGKTSLLRTLLRSARFGEVSNHPGTTRHVEGGEILIGNKKILQLYDTPGLEDSIALNRLLQQLLDDNGQQKLSALTGFLAQLSEYPEFDQEAKVIRQLLQDDLLFYVIDVREPVLGKFKDELTILTMAAKPVIPVLNFVSGSLVYLQHWRKILKEFGLHAVVEFDTVVFRFQDEKRLYEKIQALMADRYEQIQQLIDYRQQHWDKINLSAYRLVADLLIDVGAYRQDFEWSPEVEDDSRAAQQAVSLEQQKMAEQQRTEFLEAVRRAEKICVSALLKLYGFSEKDLVRQELAIRNGKWRLDLFDPTNLKNFGLDAGSAAMKGAALGVGIDAASGGLTLGTAAAIGATLGAVWSAGKRYKNEIKAKFQGKQYFCIDDPTLQVLWARQSFLLTHLGSRGHAAMEKIQLPASGRDLAQSRASSASTSQLSATQGNHSTAAHSLETVKHDKRKSDNINPLPEEWTQWIKIIRMHPEWSDLNKTKTFKSLKVGSDKSGQAYQDLVGQIVAALQQPS